jgi:uncharacterized protein (DUF2252 family)
MPSATLLKRIRLHDRGRDPERLALKYQKMRDSAFAFLRATPFLYFSDCPLPKSLAGCPRTWISGDLHVENFGVYRGSNRLVYFDINDFDEALIAPCLLDPARLATSLIVAAEQSRLPARAFKVAAHAAIASYLDALAEGKPGWIERRSARGPIKKLLRRVQRRPQSELLATRCKGRGKKRRLRIDGRHALAVAPADRERVARLLRALGEANGVGSFCRVIDVARRIAGTSSLGMERFVALCVGHGGKDGALLFDLKTEARPAALAVRGAHRGAFASEAERTVTVQLLMQAASPAWLSVLGEGRRRYVARELQPLEDRVSVASDLPTGAALLRFASDLGRLAAWAQLRAAGRYQAAGVESLMAFAARPGIAARLLGHAEGAARENRRRHRAFRALAESALLPAPRRRARAALSS